MSSSILFFLPPRALPLHSVPLLRRHPPRRDPARAPLHRCHGTPRATLTTPGGWQDAIFPPSPAPSLSHIISSPPSVWTTVHLHSLTPSGTHLQVTLARSETRILPLPLATPSDRLLVSDALLLHNIGSSSGSGTHAGHAPLRPHSTAFAADILPVSVTRGLNIDRISLADAGGRLIRAAREAADGGDGVVQMNRADAAVRLLREVGVRVVGASVEEGACVGDARMALDGFLFVGGEAGEARRVQCPAGVAAGIAAAAGVGCYVRRETFDTAGRRVGGEEEEEVEVEDSEVRRGGWDGVEAWELRAEDVLRMSSAELRAVLWREGEGTRGGESQEELVCRVGGLMDAVERREVWVAVAGAKGMYEVAGELQRGRSERGRVQNEARECEREGRWMRAVGLWERARAMREDLADCTAEDGAYDRALDRDEWYRPNR